MGYNTYFEGELTPNKPFDKDFVKYINAFSSKRHEPRDVELIKKADPLWYKNCLFGNIGPYGMYYIGPYEDWPLPAGESPDFNMPGYWCQWIIDESSNTVRWDGNKKFYNYVDWLDFIIKHFFELGGYKLNGEIFWHGENFDDAGKISVVDNVVRVYTGTILYEDELENLSHPLKDVSNGDLLKEVIKRGIL